MQSFFGQVKEIQYYGTIELLLVEVNMAKESSWRLFLSKPSIQKSGFGDLGFSSIFPSHQITWLTTQIARPRQKFGWRHRGRAGGRRGSGEGKYPHGFRIVRKLSTVVVFVSVLFVTRVNHLPSLWSTVDDVDPSPDSCIVRGT